MIWCGVAFMIFLSGGSWVTERFVAPSYCASSCPSGLDHLRIGTRGGPPSACICRDESAIETSLPDVATGVSVIAFLAACYVPFVVMVRRRRS